MKLYAILPTALQEYHSRKAQALAGLDLSLFINKRQDAYVDENKIGYVNIFGPLLNDAAPIDLELGATSYEAIEEDIQHVLEDGAKAIVFVMDSPGGQVSGLIETSELIENLPVPSVGFISGLCCSAGYHLASGMTYLVSTKSSSVGNIGAIMSFTDASRLYENMGIEFNVFYNEGADMKSIGYTPSLSEKQKEFLQASINETGKAFQDYVKANRPEVNESVFNAAWYNGTNALALGLVDEVGNAERALEIALQFSTIDNCI